jgi:hypothetical protein
MTYLDHARHILSTIGFTGEELELMAIAVAQYLESNFVERAQ